MSDKKSNGNRRKLLKSIAAGSGAVVAGRSLPESWSKPVIDSVILPAHASTTTTTTDELPLSCSGKECLQQFTCASQEVFEEDACSLSCVDVVRIDFDGSTCSTSTGVDLGEVPNTIVRLDVDQGDTGWDDQGSGSNWSRINVGESIAPGQQCQSITYDPNGNEYEIQYTVEIEQVADRRTMTVRDISICLVELD